MALLRPEKAFTEVDSREPALDDAAAKAAGATTMEAAIADAIAASEPRAAE